MPIDLHTHSTASDGTVPPGVLPELGAAAGLTALALTDHDTVAGLSDFMARGKDFPEMELIPGIEFSSHDSARELHIVGLYIDPENPELLAMIDSMRRSRQVRGELMMQKLAALGYTVTLDELIAVGAPPDAPGRPHFAQVLVNKYNFPDNKTVFERLLKRGLPGYVPRELPPPEDVIKVIKAAGGLAIWAHPFNTRHSMNNYIRRTANLLKIAGLDGLEAYYTEYTPSKRDNALRIAGELDLIVSGGSDFHGSIHPEVKLGKGTGSLNVPDEILAFLHRAREPKVVFC
jgi:predicted metal-dependent phosphoesterase TrpH